MVSGYNTTGYRGSSTSASTPKFDQVVRGDVRICKTGEQKYKITFMKAREFTLYQVWTENGDNTNRLVLTDSSKKWQERLIAEQKATGFAPTTLMAVGDCKWAFVITNAYFEKNRLVLEVSTAEIVNLSKTVRKGLKTGYFKNARFDIDSIDTKFFTYNNLSECNNTYCVPSQGKVYGFDTLIACRNFFDSGIDCENYRKN